MLLIHVAVALASIIFSSICLIWPSIAKLKFSYLLVGLTLASGTYLVMSRPAHILSVCLSGLTYVAVVSFNLFIAHKRLSSHY